MDSHTYASSASSGYSASGAVFVCQGCNKTPCQCYVWQTGQTVFVDPVGVTEDMFKLCAICESDCEWVVCEECKGAIKLLREKMLKAMAREIEEQLS